MSTVVEQTGLGETWAALLHPKIQALQVPKLPGMNCSQCRMVEERGFAPFARCCNIYPEFPNFLLGEILVKGQAKGSAGNIEAWIDEGRSGPAYAHKPTVMHDLHDDSHYDKLADIPPCPLLDDEGRCTVYAQRPFTCIEFNCVYPPYPEIIAFWHTFHSLLGLHSLVTSRYLMKVMGFDIEKFQTTWTHQDSTTIWGNELSIQPDFLTKLWQGKEKKEFYISCHEYIQSHTETIRDEVETFRKEQLIHTLKQRDLWTREREEELLQQVLEPTHQEPSLEVWEQVANGKPILPEHNLYSLTEFEGMLLWFHQAMMGRYTMLMKIQNTESLEQSE